MRVHLESLPSSGPGQDWLASPQPGDLDCKLIALTLPPTTVNQPPLPLQQTQQTFKFMLHSFSADQICTGLPDSIEQSQSLARAMLL